MHTHWAKAKHRCGLATHSADSASSEWSRTDFASIRASVCVSALTYDNYCLCHPNLTHLNTPVYNQCGLGWIPPHTHTLHGRLSNLWDASLLYLARECAETVTQGKELRCSTWISKNQVGKRRRDIPDQSLQRAWTHAGMRISGPPKVIVTISLNTFKVTVTSPLFRTTFVYLCPHLEARDKFRGLTHWRKKGPDGWRYITKASALWQRRQADCPWFRRVRRLESEGEFIAELVWILQPTFQVKGQGFHQT